MSTKFFKKNIFMIAFMSVALVLVVILLVMVYFEHKSMREYDTRKTDLLKKINDIFRQKYAPVSVNVTRIQSDAEAFTKESRKVERKFGHPYEPALKRFAEVVAIPLKEFRAKFGEFWDAQKGKATRDLIFRRYKVRQFGEDFPKHRSTWTAAMNAFMQEAQKVTLEKIETSNVDGIFLAAMGKGRRFSDVPQRCQTFMKRMRFEMIEYYGNKKVDCADTNFSFDDTKEPSVLDIEAIARSWEIISDLAKRIADAKVDPKEDTLQLVEFSKRSLDGDKDGDYTSYRFSFTVNADMATIRRIVKKLNDAYTENRIYAVRDIRISRTVDRVNDILIESERLKDNLDYDTSGDENSLNPVEPGRPGAPRIDSGRFPVVNTPRRTVGRVDPRRAATGRVASSLRGQTDSRRSGTAVAGSRPLASARTAPEKKKILTPNDPGYARTIIGENNICRAEFDIDYIVYDNMSDD